MIRFLVLLSPSYSTRTRRSCKNRHSPPRQAQNHRAIHFTHPQKERIHRRNHQHLSLTTPPLLPPPPPPPPPPHVRMRQKNGVKIELHSIQTMHAHHHHQLVHSGVNSHSVGPTALHPQQQRKFCMPLPHGCSPARTAAPLHLTPKHAALLVGLLQYPIHIDLPKGGPSFRAGAANLLATLNCSSSSSSSPKLSTNQQGACAHMHALLHVRNSKPWQEVNTWEGPLIMKGGGCTRCLRQLLQLVAVIRSSFSHSGNMHSSCHMQGCDRMVGCYTVVPPKAVTAHHPSKLAGL